MAVAPASPSWLNSDSGAIEPKLDRMRKCGPPPSSLGRSLQRGPGSQQHALRGHSERRMRARTLLEMPQGATARRREERNGGERGGIDGAAMQEDAVASAALSDCLDSSTISARSQADQNRPDDARTMLNSTTSSGSSAARALPFSSLNPVSTNCSRRAAVCTFQGVPEPASIPGLLARRRSASNRARAVCALPEPQIAVVNAKSPPGSSQRRQPEEFLVRQMSMPRVAPCGESHGFGGREGGIAGLFVMGCRRKEKPTSSVQILPKRRKESAGGRDRPAGGPAGSPSRDPGGAQRDIARRAGAAQQVHRRRGHEHAREEASDGSKVDRRGRGRDRQVGDRVRCTRHREGPSPATIRLSQITGDPGLLAVSLLPLERCGPPAPRAVRPPRSCP